MGYINTVIKGKYKGYKIVFDKHTKSILLKKEKDSIIMDWKSKINLYVG